MSEDETKKRPLDINAAPFIPSWKKGSTKTDQRSTETQSTNISEQTLKSIDLSLKRSVNLYKKMTENFKQQTRQEERNNIFEFKTPRIGTK
jgi:hypothetical protein